MFMCSEDDESSRKVTRRSTFRFFSCAVFLSVRQNLCREETSRSDQPMSGPAERSSFRARRRDVRRAKVGKSGNFRNDRQFYSLRSVEFRSFRLRLRTLFARLRRLDPELDASSLGATRRFSSHVEMFVPSAANPAATHSFREVSLANATKIAERTLETVHLTARTHDDSDRSARFDCFRLNV